MCLQKAQQQFKAQNGSYPINKHLSTPHLPSKQGRRWMTQHHLSPYKLPESHSRLQQQRRFQPKGSLNTTTPVTSMHSLHIFIYRQMGWK